jgi:hypothetical protein
VLNTSTENKHMLSCLHLPNGDMSVKVVKSCSCVTPPLLSAQSIKDQSARNNYERFAILYSYQILPVTFKPLAHWISETVEKVKIETIKSYLTALRSHHVDQEHLTNVFNDPIIKYILKGS